MTDEKPLVEDPEQDPKAHAEYLDNIRKSYAKYGPIRPAIVSRFGIVAGAGRKEAVPEWPEYDRKKIDERVKTKFDAYAMAGMDNIHEPKSAAWWKALIAKATEALQEQLGLPDEEMCKAMIEQFPLGEASIRRYIPDKYKRQVRIEAGKKGAAAKKKKATAADLGLTEVEPAALPGIRREMARTVWEPPFPHEPDHPAAPEQPPIKADTRNATYYVQLQRAMDLLSQDYVRVAKLLEPEFRGELGALNKAISDLDQSIETRRLLKGKALKS